MQQIYAFLSILAVSTVTIASCLSCAARQYHQPGYPPNKSEPQRAAAVKILVTCDMGVEGVKRWRGSGVIIGHRTILTASHVASCPGASIIVGQLLDGTGIELVLVADSMIHDIAKLRSATDIPVFSWKWGAMPTEGVICAEVAIPDRARQCGRVTQVYPEKLGAEVHYSGYVEPGNSGSGVFDVDGNLVGIVTRRKTMGGNWMAGIMTRVDIHKDALDKYPQE